MNALHLSTYLLVGLAAGICWYHAYLPTSSLLVLFALTSAATCFLVAQSRLKAHGLYLFMGLLAFALGASRAHYLDAQHAGLRKIHGKLVAFTAKIQDVKVAPGKKNPCVLRVATKNNVTLQLYVPRLIDCSPGDIIAVHGTRAPEHIPINFQRYLQKEGVAATLFLKQDSFSITQSPRQSPSKLLFKIRNYTLRSLSTKMSDATKKLFAMILLGYKDGTDTKQLNRSFAQWGTIHQLARSGLHLVIFIALWGLLLNCLPLAFAIRQFLLIALVAFYMLISWPSISIVRAFIMFFLHKLLSAFKIPVHSLYIFIITSLWVLLHNPLQLFFLDFQLSFALAGAIVLFYYFKKSYANY